MEKQEFEKLLYKYRSNQCSQEELERLENWYVGFEREVEKIDAVPAGKLEQLFLKISTRIHRPAVIYRRRILYSLSWAAAVVIIGLGIMLLWPSSEGTLSIRSSIVPGKECAFLQLSDGREVELEQVNSIEEKSGCIIRNDSMKILDYRTVGDDERNLYNTLTVPLGGEYQVILSDGTSVHLNSGSVFKYPVKFGKGIRRVNLNGEGYFDVAHDGSPFVVETMDINVQVLGTSFNVSVYPEAKQVAMTLVTGKVVVCNNNDAAEYMITPGHTFSYLRTSKEVQILSGDEELYTGWVDGIFRFRNMRLEDIMIQLNRWYNCRISYSDEALKELRFSGAAERDRPVEYLLNMIAAVTKIHFDIVDDQIFIRR